MSIKKPVPLVSGANQKLCPVCGKRSYSAAGTHPQCAQRRADEQRKEKMVAEKKKEAAEPPKKSPQQQRSWKKKCPNCDAEVHVRKKSCDCGHNFFGR
jgi:hypothetical protein